MAKYHVTLSGFAGFETLTEARAFAKVLNETLNDKAEQNMIHATIRDIQSHRDLAVEEPTPDHSNIRYGLQTANARVGQLASYSKKTTVISEETDWFTLLIELDGNRFFVNEEKFIEICRYTLKSDVSFDDFISGIPEAK